MLKVPFKNRRAERLGVAILALSFCIGVTGLAIGLAPSGQRLVWGAAALAAGVAFMRLTARGRRGTPILTYHSVSPDAAWLPWAAEISIRPDTLDRHLRLFRRMGYDIVQTEDWVITRRDGLRAPKRPLMLHFDDGYLDNRLHAWPILRAHDATATLFVSTDFVAPGDDLRTRGPDDGYLNWAELRQMDNSPEWRIEAHGTDHGRVVTGTREVGRLTSESVGREAWMQWAMMPGDKHDWYRRAPVVPVGTAIRESRPALSGPALGESRADYLARVSHTLIAARNRIARNLGRAPRLFCWPQNQTSHDARRIARDVGYMATTVGAHRNTVADPYMDLSRLHAGQDHAGFRCGWIDDIALRAHLRCFEGAFLWALPLAVIGLIRRTARLVGSFGDQGHHVRGKVLGI